MDNQLIILADRFGRVSELKNKIEAHQKNLKERLMSIMDETEEPEIIGYNFKVIPVEGKTTVWNTEKIEKLAKETGMKMHLLRHVTKYSYLRSYKL